MTSIVTCVGSGEYKIIFTTDIKEDYETMEEVARLILDVRNAERKRIENTVAVLDIGIQCNGNIQDKCRG